MSKKKKFNSVISTVKCVCYVSQSEYKPFPPELYWVHD